MEIVLLISFRFFSGRENRYDSVIIGNMELPFRSTCGGPVG